MRPPRQTGSRPRFSKRSRPSDPAVWSAPTLDCQRDLAVEGARLAAEAGTGVQFEHWSFRMVARPRSGPVGADNPRCGTQFRSFCEAGHTKLRPTPCRKKTFTI